MARGPIRNVPSPPGSKAGNPYTRFIPREELPDFAAWQPGSFGQPGQAEAQAPAPEPAQPTEADWQDQLAAARQAGYHDGYRDGLVALEGFKQSFASQATAQVGQLLASLDRDFLALEGQAAQAVADIAVQLARQVLRSELLAQPEAVTRVATEAVNAMLLSARQLTVHLHPDDLPLVAEGAADLLDARSARLVVDEAMARGDCRVESELGAVDATVATRWAQAAGALGNGQPWHDEPDAEHAP